MKCLSIALASVVGLAACADPDPDAYRTLQDGGTTTVNDARPAPPPPQDGGGSGGGDAASGPNAWLINQWTTGASEATSTVQSYHVTEDGEVIIPLVLGSGTTLYFRVPLPDGTTFPAQVRIAASGLTYHRIDETNTVHVLAAADVGAYLAAPVSTDFCASTPVVATGTVFVNAVAAPVKVGLGIDLFSAKWCPFKLGNCPGKTCERTLLGHTFAATCHRMNLGAWLGQQCICSYD